MMVDGHGVDGGGGGPPPQRLPAIGVLQDRRHGVSDSDTINVGPLFSLVDSCAARVAPCCTVLPIRSIGQQLKEVDVLVIPGGTPSSVHKALGGRNGAARLRAFLSRGGGIVGVCAGASILYDMGLLSPRVRMVEDRLWGDSGWHQRVLVETTQADPWDQPGFSFFSAMAAPLELAAYYHNGPVFEIAEGEHDGSRVHVLARFVSDVAHDKKTAHDGVMEANGLATGAGQWVCPCCTNVNSAASARCAAPRASCGKAARDKVYPAVGTMPNKVAAVAVDHSTGTADSSTMAPGTEGGGRIVALSVHIEAGLHKELFFQLVLWAAERAAISTA
eukprot:m.110744 g.110744  ORF g.110744 m.110744 type:complete len:332 (+) comp21329_c0_seq1:67-1062(+)